MSNLAGYEQDHFQACVREYLWVNYELQRQQKARWKQLIFTSSCRSAFSMLFIISLKHNDVSETKVGDAMRTILEQPPA